MMQRLQDRVRAGHVHYVTGEIEPERWPALATKLNGLYRLDRTIKQRSRDRAKGIASAMLIAYYDGRANVVRWVLQVSDGIHAAHTMERVKNATTAEGRLTLPALGYELVRLDDKWTWRMTPEHQQEWHRRIHEAANQRDPDTAGMLARQIVWSLSWVPGFRGVRKDAFGLRGALLGAWRRKRDKKDMKLLPPRPWPRISYCRRVASH